MPGTWKAVLLDVYRRVTTPYRCVAMQRRKGAGQAPLLIFFYHRVADRDPVPWSLSNRQFTQHIDWLQGHCDMISLEEVQERMREGHNTRPAAHITFDDGYAENCDDALPLLIARNIPCTYFVTLDHVVSRRPFEHDVRIGKRFPVNSIGQLRHLSDAGMEIGAHTRTHPDLGSLHELGRLHDEVLVSREELQQQLGTSVRYFAFPFGLHVNLNARVFHMAREAGIEACVSAYGGYNFPGDDTFHLQRLHGDPQLSRIKNLATLDPRKLLLSRFEYGRLEDDPELIDFLERQYAEAVT